MSSHARRCFSFAKMLKCVVGFPILRDLNCIETSHNVVPVVQKLDDTAVDDTAGLSTPPPPPVRCITFQWIMPLISLILIHQIVRYQVDGII